MEKIWNVDKIPLKLKVDEMFRRYLYDGIREIWLINSERPDDRLEGRKIGIKFGKEISVR